VLFVAADHSLPDSFENAIVHVSSVGFQVLFETHYHLVQIPLLEELHEVLEELSLLC
jgi:hypothetical protein